MMPIVPTADLPNGRSSLYLERVSKSCFAYIQPTIVIRCTIHIPASRRAKLTSTERLALKVARVKGVPATKLAVTNQHLVFSKKSGQLRVVGWKDCATHLLQTTKQVRNTQTQEDDFVSNFECVLAFTASPLQTIENAYER